MQRNIEEENPAMIIWEEAMENIKTQTVGEISKDILKTYLNREHTTSYCQSIQSSISLWLQKSFPKLGDLITNYVTQFSMVKDVPPSPKLREEEDSETSK